MRDFLETGHLGPLSPDADLLEVAELLGPPDIWLTRNMDRYPLFWIYSPKGRKQNAPRLEISFELDAPHKVDMLQLIALFNLEKKVFGFGKSVRVSADGLSAMTPSRFLKKGYWASDDTTLYISNQNLELVMTHGRMTLHFVVSDQHLDHSDESVRRKIIDQFGEAPEFRQIDKLYRVYRVTSQHVETPFYQGEIFEKYCDGRQYLESMKNEPDLQPANRL